MAKYAEPWNVNPLPNKEEISIVEETIVSAPIIEEIPVVAPVEAKKTVKKQEPIPGQ